MALDPMLTSSQAAAILGIAEITLREWRTTKRVTIPYFKIGTAVRYKESDLAAWIEAQRVAS